jgi:predicted kinase
MHDHAPTVYLLAGSASAGARTYAQVLAAQGVVWLGPADRDEVGARLAEHIDAGRDVVLDEGLGEPEDRDNLKRLVEDHGAQWCVIHFSNDHVDAVQRLRDREVSRSRSPRS